MKRISSGQGATDFGASTGMSHDQLMGRPEEETVVQEYEVPPILEPLNWDEPAAEHKWARPNVRERIATLIHTELVKDEISQGNVKSIGFVPAWIIAAADAIAAEYQ